MPASSRSGRGLLILSPFLKKLMHLDKTIEPEEYPGGVVEPE